MEISLLEQVDKALDSIRPYLKTDGGNVEVVEITDDKIVKVKLLGACDGCSMSSMTMKGGIEEAIIKSVPEITGVEEIK